MSLRLVHILTLFGMLAFATPSLYSQSSEPMDSIEISEVVKLAKHKIHTAVDEAKFKLDSLSERINELKIALKDKELELSEDDKKKIKLKLEKFKEQKDRFASEWFEPNGKFDQLADRVQEKVLVKMNAALERLGKLKGLEQIYLWNNCD